MIGYVLIAIHVLFMIWAVIDILMEESFNVVKGKNAKILWLLVVIFVPFGAVFVYPIVERRMYLKPRSRVSKTIEKYR